VASLFANGDEENNGIKTPTTVFILAHGYLCPFVVFSIGGDKIRLLRIQASNGTDSLCSFRLPRAKHSQLVEKGSSSC
jgi:hypothetical protein